MNSPVCYVFSFRIFGDLKNYTFLETLGSTASEKQCLHFFQAPYGRHLGFSKWRLFFFWNPAISQLLIILDTYIFEVKESSVTDRVKAMLDDTDAVTITTDGWTSLCTESYIAVTCHFITSDFKLDSCLLQCNKFTERQEREPWVERLQLSCRPWCCWTAMHRHMTVKLRYIYDNRPSVC